MWEKIYNLEQSLKELPEKQLNVNANFYFRVLNTFWKTWKEPECCIHDMSYSGGKETPN